MELTKVIIKAHVHVHAAELATQAENSLAAWNELNKLNRLLDDKLYMEAERGRPGRRKKS